MGIFENGHLLQGRYRVSKLLDEGGMSWVYQAEHVLLDQSVALKVVKPLGPDVNVERETRQLLSEAALMARLNHPNLVRVFDLFMEEGLPVLVLEVVEGRNLEQIRIRSPQQLSESRVLIWAQAIIDALEYLHAQNPPIIVRDLKPKNVMLGRDGRIRLVDFGLAKELSKSGRGTLPGVRGLGSDGFAPPEQHAKEGTDARTDVYALGATLYYLLAGKPPPGAITRLTDAGALRDLREVNETVSERTWKAVEKMLSLEAEDRPESATMARELILPELPPRGRQGRRCVECNLLLTAELHEGVEIDRCRECGGIWLDRGELASLTELARDPVEMDLDDDGSGQGRRIWRFLKGLFD